LIDQRNCGKNKWYVLLKTKQLRKRHGKQPWVPKVCCLTLCLSHWAISFSRKQKNTCCFKRFKRTECGHMFIMIFSVQCGGPISIANLVSTTPVSLCHESRWFLIRK
jgi:hypothetical protein